MSSTVKFNVGGFKYEVSRSLISMYPQSFLAKTASSPWNTSSDKEIFIERDGDRFRYVLDYLRDGQVFVPATVAKEAVLLDLDYYGLDYNEDVVIGTETCTNSYEPRDQLEANLIHFIHQGSLALNSSANIREFWKIYGGWYSKQEIRRTVLRLEAENKISKAFDDDHFVLLKKHRS